MSTSSDPTFNISVDSASIKDSVSFFGSVSVGQQVIDGSLESVAAALVNLGLCTLTAPEPVPEPVPEPPCPVAKINPSLCAGPFDAGLSNSEIKDVSVFEDTIAVGTRFDGENVGSVQVYFRVNGMWSKEGPSVVGSGAVGASQQGSAVSIHGNTLVVGGPMDNGSQGAVWVFTREDFETTWTQQGPKITVAGSILFGMSVHVRGDTLVVGSIGDTGMQGSFSVFKRFGGSWIPEQTNIVPSDLVGAAHVGSVVKINDQENTIAVAGNWDNNTVGAVWVYRLVNDVWVQDGTKITGYDADNILPIYQGYNVAISGDGNYLVFSGAHDSFEEGAVWCFKYVSGVWTQESAKIKWLGPLFGRSLDMSSCGTVMAVGTTYNVYVFKKIEGVWTYVCDRSVNDLIDFGTHISLDPAAGDLVVTSSDPEPLSMYIYRM